MSGSFANKVYTAPRQRVRELSQVVLSRVDRNAKLRILDIGCGTGQQVFDLAGELPYTRFVGVDISEPNIRIAQEGACNQNLSKRVRFTHCDYLELCESPFDLIVSDSSLQLIDASRELLFNKIGRDLRHSGLLVCTLPDSSFYNFCLFALRRAFRAIRIPLMDRIVFDAGRLLHGGELCDDMIRERIEYMYLLPHFQYGRGLKSKLFAHFDLELVDLASTHHASIAQPIHRLAIFQKRVSSE